MPVLDPKEIDDLAKATALLIDRDDFTCRLYRRPEGKAVWNLVRRYRIAVGADGYNTPRGIYTVRSKTRTRRGISRTRPWCPRTSAAA